VVSPMFPVRCVTYVPGLYRMHPNIAVQRSALRAAADRKRSPHGDGGKSARAKRSPRGIALQGEDEWRAQTK
jgi:hypothetical protein